MPECEEIIDLKDRSDTGTCSGNKLLLTVWKENFELHPDLSPLRVLGAVEQTNVGLSYENGKRLSDRESPFSSVF